MAEHVSALFDDYAERFVRGERPDPRAYFERAGEGADELGTLIDRFLERVPPPAASDDAITLAEAWVAGHSPLVGLRAARGLRRGEVVDHLIAALGLDRGKREKVGGYYHELENGLLDVARVDSRVWEALAEKLKARVGDLLAWRPRPLAAEGVYLRSASEAMPAATASLSLPAKVSGAPEEFDEIDRLFTGGVAG
ncbi:MAG: hypothetical protein H0U03_10365 [Actinobacteria bacterium]|nr:hypothetical protein [Actinomycetota bacterium]